ncbi:conserved hypothetical protein [Vibrio phage 199E37-1]|nr:conserved hypothetical protein [Vibrio phage 199E37-1]
MRIVKDNAFMAICKACNDELRPIDRADLKTQAEVIKKHGEKAELLGFSTIAMKVKIGQINGVLRER